MNPQTINPRVAAVNAEIARQGNTSFSVAPSAPTYVPPNEPIDASALGNVKPINIPEKPIPTSAAGLSGVSQGVVEQTRMAQKLEQDKMQAETAKESKQSSLEDTFKEYLGITQSVGQMEKEAGIDIKAQKATDVTNQIEALSRAKQNEIRALEQQPGTMAQKAQRQADIERQYAFQEADLALIQSAANRDLATAQNILQRKIDLQLEVLGKQLEFEKFMYNENKEIFTKAEERQFQNMIKEDERAYSQEKQRVETLEKIKLQLLMSASEQGAPSSVLQAIQSAKEPQSAIVSAGQWGGDLLTKQLKQVQLAAALQELNQKQEDAANGSGGKPLTAAQQTALSYANRVFDANEIVNEIGEKFTSGINTITQFAPNALKSGDRQRFEQAQRNFVNAVLRRESGAAISESEFDSARKQYFPQPGDSAPVIEQKRLNRERTLENLLREGGQEISQINQITDPLGLGITTNTNPLNI